LRQDHLGSQPDHFSCQREILITPAASEAIVDMDIAPLRPSEPLEFLTKCREAGFGYRIVSRQARERADAPHSLPFLRPCRERPRGRAAEQRDELAPFHCPVSPVLPTERIAHPSTAGDCCAAEFQTRLCRVRVIRDRSIRQPLPPHVRFAPKADNQVDVSLSPALCHKRTIALQHISLFDHLVGRYSRNGIYGTPDLITPA